MTGSPRPAQLRPRRSQTRRRQQAATTPIFRPERASPQGIRWAQETDDTWRESGEPIVAQLRAEAVRKLPDGSEILFSAVPAEIQACALAGQGRWQDASAKAQQVAQALSFGGATTKGYRGFWLYLAGIWAYRAASNGAPAASGSLANARALIRQAEQTAEGTWARYMPLLPAMEAPALPAHDDQAVATAMNLLRKIAPGQLDKRLGNMIEGLKETAASAYEPALTQLGIFLGAEANKPSGTGRCDSTWCWGNHLWAVVEAKSDQEPDGVMAHKDIRQVNDQLRILKSDRKHKVIPDGSFTALISPTRLGGTPRGSRTGELAYLPRLRSGRRRAAAPSRPGGGCGRGRRGGSRLSVRIRPGR
ncbi:hypothetical protein OG747_52900 (plasmid) [Streptomyces sp. NBC_01384]|uniref:hypothetical protein n=1 Tax=Streptomyces sp. NBC_01384 TaxID=2903847 RepID=UPI002F910EE2